jgi:hypothetical protein
MGISNFELASIPIICLSHGWQNLWKGSTGKLDKSLSIT